MDITLIPSVSPFSNFFSKPFAHCITVMTNFDLEMKRYRLSDSVFLFEILYKIFEYALINRARDPYEEIFVLIFKAYGPKEVRSMRLECHNKYFPYGPKSWLIRALLYTYTNKVAYDEILLS